MSEAQSSEFDVNPKLLGEAIEKKELITIYGGVEVIASKLKTNLETGLPQDKALLEKRREYFGSNFIPPKLPHSYFYYLFKAFQDYMLLIVLFGGILFFAVDTFKHPNKPAVDGISIIVTVLVVVLVVSINDYTKELKFKRLHNSIKLSNTCTVLRGGQIIEINTADLVVGDIYILKYGDLVPADGVLFQGDNVRVEESSITGESDLVKKSPDSPYLFGSTHIMDGTGKALIVATGHNSQTGRILALLDASKKIKAKKTKKVVEDKPISIHEENTQKNKSILQEKLNKLALLIGKVGFAFGLIVTIVNFIIFSIDTYFGKNATGFKTDHILIYLEFILHGVTVIIVAIPEGLPLAVTLALAYSVYRMLDENNLVRQLHSCETMGNATTICSDKTGTLTMNRMTVVEVFLCGEKIDEIKDTFIYSPSIIECFCESICFNKNPASSLIDPPVPGAPLVQVGNKTDCALLGFLQYFGTNYDDFIKNTTSRTVKIFPFNSDKKMMSVVLKRENSFRVYVKGAPDVLLQRCDKIIWNNEIIEMTENHIKITQEEILKMSSNSLRSILLAYQEIPFNFNEKEILEDDIVNRLIFMAVVGIEDPVRPEVPDAIRVCHHAGITVRMVTGDNLETAKSIALKCGILDSNDTGFVMDSRSFNSKIRDENGVFCQNKFDKIWPNLRVLARSTPQDKYTLVNGLINTKIPNKQQIVAVTGDGTNDAPALKRADVGFAMGLTGTDIAKEASDIIITDDNFVHIISAILWGRNVYDSISKFMQFQLTVNFSAVFLTLITLFARKTSALTPIMLILINLIMDSLASLALATDSPCRDLLDRKPYSRNRGLLSKNMIVFILLHGLYQILVCLILVYLAPSLFSIDDAFELRNFNSLHELEKVDTLHITLIFNVFVFMQIFNEFNARKVHGERNVFENFYKNHIFIAVVVGTAVVQILIIQFTYSFFHVVPLSLELWAWSIFIAFSVLLFHQIIVVWLSKYINIPKRFRIHKGIPSSSVLAEEGTVLDGRLLWIRGIHKLQQELRVIEAFKLNLVPCKPPNHEIEIIEDV